MILGLRVPHLEAPQQPGLPDPRGVCGELCALRLRFAPSPGAQLGGPCGACRGRYPLTPATLKSPGLVLGVMPDAPAPQKSRQGSRSNRERPNSGTRDTWLGEGI